jgi:ferredoxin-NADP reductase
MTTPPTKKLRIIYGSLVGFLNAPFVGIGGFYTTPEIALVLGNIFSYIVSSKEKLILKLKQKIKIADNTYDFVFGSDKNLNFKPGQYLEWTLQHEKMDNRGMRRYFTIASSPTEKEIIMGVKFYDKPSSYKQSLVSLKPGEIVVASQLAGDFTLSENKDKKLTFIAGGIGVTPFRSMIKYLIDKNEKRDIIIFYSNRVFTDIAYKEIFDQAQQKLKIKTIYCLSDLNSIPQGWKGEKGFVNEGMIKKYAPDFMDRMFYISGPRSMILTFQKALKNAGVHKSHIRTDFFPGFA